MIKKEYIIYLEYYKKEIEKKLNIKIISMDNLYEYRKYSLLSYNCEIVRNCIYSRLNKEIELIIFNKIYNILKRI